MKKTKVILALLTTLCVAMTTHAGRDYDLRLHTSSATLRVGLAGANPADAVLTSSGAAIVQSTSTTAGHKPFRVKNQAGAEILSVTQGGTVTAGTFAGNLTGNLTGNASGTATALAANGANCLSGNYPLGVDASGAAESCASVGAGDTILAATQTFSGENTFTHSALPFFWRTISTGTFIITSTSYNITTNDLFPGASITSSATYRLSFGFHAAARRQYSLRFNDDAAGNYKVFNVGRSQAAANVGCGAVGVTFIDLEVNCSDPTMLSVTGSVTIESEVHDQTRIHVTGTSTGERDGAGTWEGGTISAYYDGASALSSIQLHCNGLCTGRFILEKFSNTW